MISPARGLSNRDLAGQRGKGQRTVIGLENRCAAPPGPCQTTGG